MAFGWKDVCLSVILCSCFAKLKNGDGGTTLSLGWRIILTPSFLLWQGSPVTNNSILTVNNKLFTGMVHVCADYWSLHVFGLTKCMLVYRRCGACKNYKVGSCIENKPRYVDTSIFHWGISGVQNQRNAWTEFSLSFLARLHETIFGYRSAFYSTL